MTVEQLNGISRKLAITYVRKLAMFLARDLNTKDHISDAEIAVYFERDRTAIYHHYNDVKSKLDFYTEMVEDITAIKKIIVGSSMTVNQVKRRIL